VTHRSFSDVVPIDFDNEMGVLRCGIWTRLGSNYCHTHWTRWRGLSVRCGRGTNVTSVGISLKELGGSDIKMLEIWYRD